MPVNIHGKEYKTVAERLVELAEHTEGKYSLKTHIIGDVTETVLIRATLELERGTFVGHAYEKEDAGYINKTSHVENCETSAIGRALASAGYTGSEFASADEVANAIKQQDDIKTRLSKQQVMDLLSAAGDVDEKTYEMIAEKIDPKDTNTPPEINKSNYKVSLDKLKGMKKK